VCLEDRDLVWSKKKYLKNSTTYRDAYIKQDNAKAIQQERRLLIKAMKKARVLGLDSKVIDRHLFVGEERFKCETIPTLKEARIVFIFFRLVLQILFQIQFGLSSQVQGSS